MAFTKYVNKKMAFLSAEENQLKVKGERLKDNG